MLAQGPALFMMCYINSGEFERLLNVTTETCCLTKPYRQGARAFT